MPKFRGLPRGKRPDYFGSKQHRYNTPRTVGDWETRPSRGNRRWSFFLRGKSERGLRFQIDDPLAARKYRSFRRLWCRSLKIDPIPFTPVSDNGQAKGWRFLSPSSDTGYWEVVAYPGDDEQAEWCEYIPGQPQWNCITYIDDAGVEQEICTDGPIRYEYENDPSNIPDNQCEYDVQCRTIGRVSYIDDTFSLMNKPGNIIDLPNVDPNKLLFMNVIVDFDLGPCGGPNSTLAIRTEQQGGLDTCEWGNGESYTGPNLTFSVTENAVPTYFDVYIKLHGETDAEYKTRLQGSSISEELTKSEVDVAVEARGRCSSIAGWLTGATIEGVSVSLGGAYGCSDRTTYGRNTVYLLDGTSYVIDVTDDPENRTGWWLSWNLFREWTTISTDLGDNYTYLSKQYNYWDGTAYVRSAIWEGNGDYNFKLYSEGTLIVDKNYTYDPSPVLTSDGESGVWMMYVDRDGVEIYSDGPFSRDPAGLWFSRQKQVSYYDCEKKVEGNPPCTLVVYSGDTEIRRVTREDGTCPVMPPINDGGGNRLPTPGIRCTPVSYPGDPYYGIIWNEGEYSAPTSEYYYTCTCPYYSGQTASLSDSLDANRSFSSGAPYFRYQQRVCKHIMAAMRVNGDLTDADIPYDEQVEAQFYEGLNTRRYLETNPFIIPLQTCTPEYVDELMEELEMEAEPPINSRTGMTWHDWDQSDKFGKWGDNWDSASKF